MFFWKKKDKRAGKTLAGGFGVSVEPALNEFIQLEHMLSEYCESCVEKIIGFRYDATGVFGYEFYHKNDKLCAVSSSVVPSPPVMIYGFDNEWESEFEDCTVYPGLTRYVLDRKSKSQVAKVVYRDFGKYELNESISVYCDTKKYKFFYDDEMIADIHRFEGDFGWKPDSKYYEYEAYFEVKMSQGINSELKMLIMAFPMIRFAF